MRKKKDFLSALRDSPLLFDGAMGTMIYERGVFLNSCYDELCLSRAKLVLGIHTEYIDSGADVIETNSFGANRVKLARFGLADRVEDINRAAARIAREAAGDGVYVAASIGPCPALERAQEKAGCACDEDVFEEQISALVLEDVDLVALETFSDIAQLQLAALVAKRHGLVVLASFMLEPVQPERYARPAVETFARRLEADANVDVIGLNCGLGPAELLPVARDVVSISKKPVVVMPNAGGASEIGGRRLYLNSPEYFTEYCRRYIEVGARGVGGCCGTTPSHIRMASRAVKTMSGVKRHVSIVSSPIKASAGSAAPFAEKSAFAAKLASGVKVVSIEMIPPPSCGSLKDFLAKCEICRRSGADAVNLPDGPRASARVSVLATAAAVLREVGIEPIPHYCCRDRNLIGMQSDLLGAQALGIKNFLFVTGDPPKLGIYPDATGVFDLDSIGLTKLAANLNSGFDAAGQEIGRPAAMAVGVGANPVSVEMDRETERFFRKIDAGAEFAFTQPVFDPEALLRFIDRVAGHRKTIPVIAGIYPLLSFKNAEFMNNYVPGVAVPGHVLERMSRCRNREDSLKTGIDIAREIKGRISGSVSGFQISAPFGRVEPALALMA